MNNVHTITAKCRGEVYAACIDVCPVDCIISGIHEDSPRSIIDPDVCIDCGVCLPECPIGAIQDNTADDEPTLAFNRNMVKVFKEQDWKPEGRAPDEEPNRLDNKLRGYNPRPSSPYSESSKETVVKLRVDGNAWGALIGPNIQEGIAGFGDTESEALQELALNLRRKGR